MSSGPTRGTDWRCSLIRPPLPEGTQAAGRRRCHRPGVVPCGDRRKRGLVPRDGLSQRRPPRKRATPSPKSWAARNVYYFLTPMAKGRLQVLPLAYDVHKQIWYDVGGQRRPPLPRPPPARRGPSMDRPPLHLQHHLLRLPRQPIGHQLRSRRPTPIAPRGARRASVASPATGPADSM